MSTLGLVKNKNVVFSKNEILIKCANLTRLDYIVVVWLSGLKFTSFLISCEVSKRSSNDDFEYNQYILQKGVILIMVHVLPSPLFFRDLVHRCDLCQQDMFALLSFTKHIHSEKHQSNLTQWKYKSETTSLPVNSEQVFNPFLQNSNINLSSPFLNSTRPSSFMQAPTQVYPQLNVACDTRAGSSFMPTSYTTNSR